MVVECDVPPGVITGENVRKLMKHAKDNGYAIPAFNCTRYVLSRGNVSKDILSYYTRIFRDESVVLPP